MRVLSLSSRPRLTYLITITRRDDTVTRVHSRSQVLTIGDETFLPCPGLVIGDLTERNDGTPPTIGIKAYMQEGGIFEPSEISDRKYEAAQVEIDLYDIASSLISPSPRNFWFVGRIGRIEYDTSGNFSFDVNSKFAVPRDIFVRTYELMCDADFGDPRRCKIPTFPNVDITSRDLNDVERLEVIAVGERRRIRFGNDETPQDYANVYLEATVGGTTGAVAPPLSPATSATVGTVTVDGSVTWITRNAFARYARVDELIDPHNFKLDILPDPRASDNAWFNPGRLFMRSGYSNNRSARIGSWRASDYQVTVFQPLGELIAVGDWLEIAPDCDKTLNMCVTKYGNAFNYRGFPHLAGDKFVTSIIINTGSSYPWNNDPPVVDAPASEAAEFAVGET